MKRAGKEDIMKDMQHQKEMLAARHISGEYKYSDGTVFKYTGSYEKKFLEYLDTILNWPSSDIMAPAPQIILYRDFDGKERSHIPDFYLTSLNLIVNIKSSTNKFYRLRDLDTERAQDLAVKNTGLNYIKIYDNQFDKFMNGVDEIKEAVEKKIQKQVIFESENVVDDKVSVLLNEVSY